MNHERRHNQLSMIAVMAANRVIGKNNKMPWHYRADLQHFKQVTMGKPVIMGRLTFESIGRALPGRHNIVITRQPDYQATGASVVNSVADAIALAEQEDKEIMVIGGGKLYETLLAQTQKIYLTLIGRDYAGDTYFPELDRIQWEEVAREDFPSDELHPHPYSFVTLKRRS